MTPTVEKRIARVQGNVQVNLTRRMKDREEVIISRLVTAYRGGQLTSEILFGGIAAIAELRSIINDAERDLMQATDDVSSFKG